MHVLYGTGGGQVAGNVLVLFGDEGSLVVDTGYPQYVPKYREEMPRLGGGAVTHAINTHWHDDHSEGNKVFGPDGALIVAHSNARTMLMRDNKINVVRTILDQPAFPPAALPVITFDDRIERVLRRRAPRARARVARAHGRRRRRDLARQQRRAHGRRVPVGRYPFADVDNGGDFDGVIEFCRGILERIDRDTVIVPGHGRTATYAI